MALSKINTNSIADDAVTTAKVNPAQTDITSVGTLTSFASTGIDDNADAVAMTIDSSERIGIGTTSPAAPLHIDTGTTTDIMRFGADGRWGFIRDNSDSRYVSFARGMNSSATRVFSIDGDNGLMGIGIVDPTSYNNYGNGLVINKSSQSGSAGISLISATDGYGSIYFNDGTGNNTIAKIEYGHTNNEFKTATNGQVKHKIAENGTHTFTMKDTDGGTNTAIWGSGTNSYIQGVSGEIYARDSAGNNTLLSPHRFEYIPNGASEEGAWAYLSKKSESNIKTEKDEDGKDVPVVDTTEAKNFTYVNVDMMKVVREVEKLTGIKLVYTGNQDGDDGSTVKDDIIAGLIKRIEALESK